MVSLVAIALTTACQSGDASGQGEASAEEASESRFPDTRAGEIMREVFAAHGSGRLDQSSVRFNFRGRWYEARRDGGQYAYVRTFRDSSGRKVRDVLSNDGFYREIDGERVHLTEKKRAAYSRSVNSVIYFALLPYFLADPAAQMEYLGEARIDGQPYHKIGVTFRRAGGGEDFEDEFVYWFHRDRRTMDYLAYNYQRDGGGARFREAYNVRTIKGVRLADYVNYQPKTETRAVRTFDSLFVNDGLKELSRIELDSIEIQLDDRPVR